MYNGVSSYLREWNNYYKRKRFCKASNLIAKYICLIKLHPFSNDIIKTSKILTILSFVSPELWPLIF